MRPPSTLWRAWTMRGFATRLDLWISDVRSQSWSTLSKRCGIYFLHVVNVACALHLLFENVGRLSTMSGPSMLPTLAHDGEVVVEDRLSYRLRNPSRGDLLIVESPIEPGRIICKRLIGLPGDIVCVDPIGIKAPSAEHIKIPKGHVWIVGDNAEWSRDSREYGPVSMSLIRGRLAARVECGRGGTVQSFAIPSVS